MAFDPREERVWAFILLPVLLFDEGGILAERWKLLDGAFTARQRGTHWLDGLLCGDDGVLVLGVRLGRDTGV